MIIRLRHGCGTTIGAIIIVLCPVSVAWTADIRVWPRAEATGEFVKLGELAALSGFDPQTEAWLGKVDVFAAPRPGGELLVRMDDVRAALAEARVNLADVRLIGATRCKVSRPAEPAPAPPVVEKKAPPSPRESRRRRSTLPRRAAKPPTPDVRTIETELREYVAARAAEYGEVVDLRLNPSSAAALAVASGPTPAKIRCKSDRRLGLLSFEVETVSERGEIETIPVVAEVAVQKEVVVARRSINRGEKVTARHLKLEPRRFTDVRALGLTELAATVGQRARRLIRAGEMIQPAALETEPLVFRGQPVTVWVRQGGLVIRASGRAQQDGRLGDTIEVRRDGSERQAEVFEAMVTGPGTVNMRPVGRVTGDIRVGERTAMRN